MGSTQKYMGRRLSSTRTSTTRPATSARSPTSSSTQRKTTAPETPTSDHGGGGASDSDLIQPPSPLYQKSKMGVLCGEEFLSLRFSGIFSLLIHPFKGPSLIFYWNFEPKCFSL